MRRSDRLDVSRSLAVALTVGLALGLLVGRRGSSDAPRRPSPRRDPSAIDVRPLNGMRTAPDGETRQTPVAGPTPAQTTTTDAQQAMRATVSIRSGAAYGAGVLLTGDGLVLTASHVIIDDIVRVRMLDNRWQRASVLARDTDADLALLRTDMGGREPPEVASVLDVREGDPVWSVGSPRQLRFSVSRGIASFVGRPLRGLRFVQTDISVLPGSSGGPVFDGQGRVVGIMSFALRGSERIGFALPVDYAFERFGRHLDVERIGGGLEAFRRWANAY